MRRQLVLLPDGTTRREIVIESLADCEEAIMDPALSWMVDVEMKAVYEPLRVE